MLGDARKLPNGNQLVCWTTAGLVTEHGADGELAWQGQTRLGSALTRVRWIEDLYGPW